MLRASAVMPWAAGGAEPDAEASGGCRRTYRARISQKCAGDKSISVLVVIRERKHEAWQNQTCHLPSAVSTVTRQGSTDVRAISSPQKQHGPHSIFLVSFSLMSHVTSQLYLFRPRPGLNDKTKYDYARCRYPGLTPWTTFLRPLRG
jgi:hypothetical protein